MDNSVWELLGQMAAWHVKKRDEERAGVIGARWTWGTVAATSPLTVTLDNETDQTPATALGWTPPVGRRVVAAIAGGRVWALAAPVRDDLAPTYAHATLASDYVIADTATTDYRPVGHRHRSRRLVGLPGRWHVRLRQQLIDCDLYRHRGAERRRHRPARAGTRQQRSGLDRVPRHPFPLVADHRPVSRRPHLRAAGRLLRHHQRTETPHPTYRDHRRPSLTRGARTMTEPRPTYREVRDSIRAKAAQMPRNVDANGRSEAERQARADAATRLEAQLAAAELAEPEERPAYTGMRPNPAQGGGGTVPTPAPTNPRDAIRANARALLNR